MNSAHFLNIYYLGHTLVNIVVLSHRLPFPPNKGEKIRTFNQLEHFRRESCNVTVFCTVDSVDELACAREYEEESGFTIVTVNSGFRKLAMLVGLLTARALSVTNFYNRKLQKRFDEYMSENPVDAIFCTSSSMAEYVFKGEPLVCNRQDNRRDLIDFMDLDSDKWRQYREVSRFPMSLVYRYEETTLSRYEARIQQPSPMEILVSRPP